MPNVVRFALDSVRDLYVPGAGYFKGGILDVPQSDTRLVSRARYLTKPYGVIELGVTDSTTPHPALPAAGPGEALADPYPQYVTDQDLNTPTSSPMAALRGAFVAPGRDFPLPQQRSSDAQIKSVLLSDTDNVPGDGLTFTRVDGDLYEFASKTEGQWRPWFGGGGLAYSQNVAGNPSILPAVDRDGLSAAQWVLRCRTNSPWLLMRGHFAGSGEWNGRVQIRVNGVPIWDKPRDLGGTYDGSTGALEILFQDSSWKTVEIFHTCTRLYTLNWATGSTTQAWSPTGQKKLAILGDSWAAGTDQAKPVVSYAQELQRRVSWDVAYVGQGGTGYVSGTTNLWNLPFGDPLRIAGATDHDPDVLVVFGSINDRGKTGIGAAATALYSAVATASPATKIIVIGAQFPDDGGTAVNTTLAAATAAAPNVIGFVDPIADQWVVPGVTGPSDTQHPSAPGAEYLAYKVEQAVRRLTVAAGDTSW